MLEELCHRVGLEVSKGQSIPVIFHSLTAALLGGHPMALVPLRCWSPLFKLEYFAPIASLLPLFETLTLQISNSLLDHIIPVLSTAVEGIP